MEFLDPKQHADRYAKRFPGSPLRPELWSGDAVFATVMLSSPLAWMEMQGLHPETVSEMSSLISKWKKERANLHTGDICPVGSKPDGFSWTGFVTRNANGAGGYALLFRECARDDSFTLDLSPYLSATFAEILSGSGTARITEGTDPSSKGQTLSVLSVTIPDKLGYLWLKLR
jgi:hypothetical protein